MEPILIIFEGLDGAGTTTQSALLTNYLRDKGVPTFQTKEPTDSSIGKLIRLILKQSNQDEQPDALFKGDLANARFNAFLQYLFAADRYLHYYGAKGLEEKKRNGITVVGDRYKYSATAYSSPFKHLIDNQINDNIPDADLVFLLDVDPKIGLDRIQWRSSSDFYETLDTLTIVRKTYLDMAREKNFIVIDSNKSIDFVHHKVTSYLEEHYSFTISKNNEHLYLSTPKAN